MLGRPVAAAALGEVLARVDAHAAKVVNKNKLFPIHVLDLARSRRLVFPRDPVFLDPGVVVPVGVGNIVNTPRGRE